MNKTIFVEQPLERNAFHVIKNNSWTANSSERIFLAINDDSRFRSSRDAENVLMKLEFYLQLDSFTQQKSISFALLDKHSTLSCFEILSFLCREIFTIGVTREESEEKERRKKKTLETRTHIAEWRGKKSRKSSTELFNYCF